MTRLQLHTCVFQASLSNVHHQSGYGDLGKALSFQSPDFVHCTCRATLTVSFTELALAAGPCELAAGP